MKDVIEGGSPWEQFRGQLGRIKTTSTQLCRVGRVDLQQLVAHPPKTSLQCIRHSILLARIQSTLAHTDYMLDCR